jgi:hypothetical protein
VCEVTFFLSRVEFSSEDVQEAFGCSILSENLAGKREEILPPVVAIAHQSGVAYRCGCQLVFHRSSTPWCGLQTPCATDCELIHEARESVTETVPSTLDSRQPPSKASAAEEPQPLRPARRTCAAATYAKEDRS